MPSEFAVVELRHRADVGSLQERLRESGWRQLEMSALGVKDQPTFFRAIETSLPLPEGYLSIGNWSSFEDVMWNLVLDQDSERVALFITEADVFAEQDLGDMIVGLDVLTSVARAVYAKQVDFTIFLIGQSPSFRRT